MTAQTVTVGDRVRLTPDYLAVYDYSPRSWAGRIRGTVTELRPNYDPQGRTWALVTTVERGYCFPVYTLERV